MQFIKRFVKEYPGTAHLFGGLIALALCIVGLSAVPGTGLLYGVVALATGVAAAHVIADLLAWFWVATGRAEGWEYRDY